MSANVVVISTDLRRATIKVSPGTYMADVLAEACQKLNLKGRYHLKYINRQLDLSLPFRSSNLASGAKLNLVVKSSSPTAVQVALQLPPADAAVGQGGRLTGSFPSTMTVWQVLRQFESGSVSPANAKLNITGRGVAQMVNGAARGSGQLYHESPVLNVMGRNLETFADFTRSLSQLGFDSGNVLMRVTYKITDKTLHEAMTEMSELFRAEESEKVAEAASSSKATTPVEPTKSSSEAPAAAFESSTAPAEGAMSVDGAVAGPSAYRSPPPSVSPQGEAAVASPPASDALQPISIFAAPTSSTPLAARVSASVPDSTYMPTVAHAHLHQARLQGQGQNSRLASDAELAERAAAREAQVAAVRNVTIKVRFPDNTSATWAWGTDAQGATLYRAVRSVMASPDAPFRLVLSGAGARPVEIRDAEGVVTGPGKDKSKAKVEDNSLIRGYGLRGQVLLNLVWDDAVPGSVRRRPFLREEAARRATDVVVPDLPAGEEEEEQARQSGKAAAASSGSRDKGGDDGGKKLPKWLKLPGKK